MNKENKMWAEKLLYLRIQELLHLLNRSTQGYLDKKQYKLIEKKLSNDGVYKQFNEDV